MSWLRSRLVRNRAACLELRNRWYPEPEWPGEIYVADIRAHAGDAILEIGCGRRGGVLYRVADCFNRRVGLDPDCEGVKPEDGSVELMTGDAARLPFPDASFDVIAMQNVAEHLADPLAALQEFNRALRPGGKLIIQTVNAVFPPILLARWMPYRMRVTINGILSGTESDDTFPVFYRANSMKLLRRLSAEAGLEALEMRYLSHHPTYFLFSPWVYRIAVMVERPVRRYDLLAPVRHMLHVILRKPVDFETP